MKLLNIKVFEGRNIYSHRKCIRLDVDLEGYCETPSKDIEGFNERLLLLLPDLKNHRCGIDEENGFYTRLIEGTYLAHICEHMIIALQNLVGIDVSFGKAREISEDLYFIIFQFEYEKTALKCVNLAIDIINMLTGKINDIDFEKRVAEIKDTLNDEYIGPSTGAICEEAKKRGLPIFKLGDTGLYQIGSGKYGKLIEATICSDTSAVGVDISCDKLMTKAILEKHCLPVTTGYKINNTIDLLYYADKIGYPVVLKPQFGNQGKGVIVNIKSRTELIEAYNKLIVSYKDIMLEGYVTGRDYRVCVVDGKVVAVALRIPPFIVGDGKNTIRKLIENVNKDPRRGSGHEKALTQIKIDDTLIAKLKEEGYNLETVLPSGLVVYLRGNANLSTGGVSVDCTDQICKENIEICERAASALGLNICGVDICVKDIGVPLKGQGAIVEINSAPGIRMHHYPFEGKSRNVAKAIVDMMFRDSRGSVPIIAVTGTNGKTTTTRLIAHVLSCAGYNVGMTATGGIYINNRCIEKGDTTGYESAMAVLLNKEVEIAVLETARGGIIRRGLAYDLADVGVLTNITEDHLGLDGIKTIEDLANVKSLVIEAVKDDGYAVINGDDKVSTGLINRVKSKLIIFSKYHDNKIMRENIDRGGIGIYLKEGCIYIQQGEDCIKLVSVKSIPITLRGKAKFNIENSLAAVAALVGVGTSPKVISKGICSFYCNEESNPGRFNVFDINGISVILDYGHNKDGYRAVAEVLKDMKHKRLVGIIGVPGDRLDSDILEIGRIAGENFDYIYIKEDDDKRGRAKWEVAELLKRGVLEADRIDEDNIKVLENEREALVMALDNAKCGDIIMVFLEKYEALLEIVKDRIDLSADSEAIMA
ncbi:cyanophycin synthetase [Clostridium thermarum]|uniref:cyanophycin synthetase n=1 Tax=Clostridium thermarum TaxID=1716543 RepID=UPI0013D64996|nr:cyanophycin synthetase [Clostridium thermarum]